ncbi:hypothetical protein Lser_V15G02808 [Lactuca serriola]
MGTNPLQTKTMVVMRNRKLKERFRWRFFVGETGKNAD